MTSNITPIFGTNAGDNLYGTGRSEVFSSKGGDDRVIANSGSDEVFGGSGNDLLYGNSGNDVLYGGGGSTYANMRALSFENDYQGRVTFLNEGAGYKNALGMYSIGDDGAISDVRILFPNTSKVGSGGNLIPGESAVDVKVEAGQQFGFFIVSNGYSRGADNAAMLADPNAQFVLRAPDGSLGNLHKAEALELFYVDPDSKAEVPVRSQYGYDIYHSATSASTNHAPNPDNFGHTVGRILPHSGEIVLGFEDLRNGGDKDFDDAVFSFDIGKANAQALVADKPGAGSAPDNDTLYGGSGNDEIHGMSGDDKAVGGNGNDEIWGNSGTDILMGDGGNDKLHGGKDDDFLYGGSGNDNLDGNSGDDQLFGEQGNDTLNGSSGDDLLSGADGNDQLKGGSGDDTLDGGVGNDKLAGGSGNDQLQGGSGSDTLEGGSGNDQLSGDNGADRLRGGSGNDTLEGGDGKDHLNGGRGQDQLVGGDGNDWLIGEKGSDILTGGDGADFFFFRFSDFDGSDDTITDFSDEDDTIIIRGAFDNFDDLFGSSAQVEDGIMISVSERDTILVENQKLDDMNADWFIV